MAPTGWFDEATGQVSLTQYFQQMASWQAAIADGEISPEELKTQGEVVINLLREIEPLVTPEQHRQISTLLSEWAVLHAMQTTALTTTLR